MIICKFSIPFVLLGYGANFSARLTKGEKSAQRNCYNAYISILSEKPRPCLRATKSFIRSTNFKFHSIKNIKKKEQVKSKASFHRRLGASSGISRDELNK